VYDDGVEARRVIGRLAIGIAIAVAAAAAALAQPAPPAAGKVTVALLPLDADARLALYGQPVAAEVARALAAEGLDVAVVGQGDPVPTRAVLVVDGTLRKSGKTAIALQLRLRDPARAEELAEVGTTAKSLIAIDRAAADAAAKLVPEVRSQLAARAKLPDRHPAPEPGSGTATAPVPAPAPAPRIELPPSIMLVASSRVALGGSPEVTVSQIVPAFERLVDDARHRPVPPRGFVGTDLRAVAAEAAAIGASLGVTIEVLALEPGRRAKVPVGRVRARVQIVRPDGRVVFDRVVRTDTLVGRRGEVDAHLAGYAGVQIADVIRVRLARALGARS
jgi:hypothetical protein